MLRERDCDPVLHSAVQVDQTVGSDKAQSVGHGTSLHALPLLRAPHCTPQALGAAEMERLDNCHPPPHVLLHASVSQGVSTQSRGVHSHFVPSTVEW